MGIVTDRLNSQGVLQPGEQGWWKVWGAKAHHVRTGDMVMTKYGDDFFECEVADIDHGNGIAPRVTTETGATCRLGAWQPIVLLRKGDHNILAA